MEDTTVEERTVSFQRTCLLKKTLQTQLEKMAIERRASKPKKLIVHVHLMISLQRLDQINQAVESQRLQCISVHRPCCGTRTRHGLKNELHTLHQRWLFSLHSHFQDNYKRESVQ